MNTRIVWLRNDLRITDNKALYAACSDLEARVLTVFIATPLQWRQHGMSPRQVTFIYENLLVLEQALAELGIPLTYHQCANFDASVKWLQSYSYKENVSEIFYNRQYEINERKRDEQLERCLKDKVICKSFDDSLMLAPGSVLNNSFQMYKRYTPFRKAFIHKLLKSEVYSLPAPKIRHNKVAIKKIIPFFDYIFHKVDGFPIGEKSGLQLLSKFCSSKIQFYNKLHDLPAINATSCLSPYLAIGVISPRQCINKLCIEFPDFLEKPNSGAFCWFNELVWREYYRHLIVAYPFLCMGRPFIDWTNNILWSKNDDALKDWQQGLTGYPIVDAAMRQLNTTGWMHNRLRMISASFLVKDLLIDWRVGEQYFMSQLLDGDLAANNGGWQWAASTGTDAVPYIRIFNPITQGKRFDPKGTFIRKWIPELKNVPDKYIHNPHDWAKNNLELLNYPLPIIEHKRARQKTQAVFYTAKNYSSQSIKKNNFCVY